MSYILVTGSSRGIGAAAKEALETRGINVIGHRSREGDQDMIAADFSDPLSAQILWNEALERSGGDIIAVVNNAGLFEQSPLNSSDIEWLDRWEDTLRVNLTAAAQISRFAVRHWQRKERRTRTACPCGEPRRVSRRLACALALCCGQRRDDRHAQNHRAFLCSGGHFELCNNAGVHRHLDGGRLSAEPRRRRPSCGHSSWPSRRTGGDRFNHHLLRARCPSEHDGCSHRRQWSKLCSVESCAHAPRHS